MRRCRRQSPGRRWPGSGSPGTSSAPGWRWRRCRRRRPGRPPPLPFAWFRVRMLLDTVVVASSTLAMPPPSALPPPPLPWAWLRSIKQSLTVTDAGVQGAVAAGRVVIPQVIEDAAARAETGEDRPGAAGRVVVAAAGLIVVQVAAADAGRTSQRNSRCRRRPRRRQGPPRWRCRCCCRRPGHCSGSGCSC